MTTLAGGASTAKDGGERARGDRPAVNVRPFTEADRPFFRSVVERLHPGATASPRDPAAMDDFFRRLAAGDVQLPAGTESFIAVDATGVPLGVLVVHPDQDFFTGHGRAYVEVLVVAEAAEGKGAGSALMRHAGAWARERGLREVALDVFAGNERARAFYERNRYRPDHVRLVKPLVDG